MSTKAFKNEKVEYFKKQFENAKVAIVTDYRGYTVEEITELRRNLQKSDSDYTVTKNTLCKLASKGTAFEAIEELMQGPSAIAFGFGDEVSAAKVVANFIKENKKGEIKGAVLDGKVLSADEAKKLALLPTKEELYAKILGSINSPATGIVYGINGVMSALVRAVDAVAKQKANQQ
ncbi:MAG: 50S ribosomal protein L10 [Candidatus Gastranaerophilales bacterium]|nr:50S ribosomal protein L10 [Candidatus Gastranaerophilales bacterium]